MVALMSNEVSEGGKDPLLETPALWFALKNSCEEALYGESGVGQGFRELDDILE